MTHDLYVFCMNCATQSIRKKISSNTELKKEDIACSKFSFNKYMCQDFSSEKSPLSFDSRKATTLRMIPLNLRILGGCLREVRLYYVLFLCWSSLRTPGQLKICWRADVHSAKHVQGETDAFAGFDREEKRAVANNKRRNYIITVSTFCANYVLSLSLLSNI